MRVVSSRSSLAVLAAAAAVVLALAPAGSEEDRFRRSKDARMSEKQTEKDLPGRIGAMPTSERDRVAEIQAELARLRSRTRALEQENAALADRLDELEGAVSVSGSRVTIQSAGTVEIRAAALDARAATSEFSGVLKAQTVVADTVSAKTMTPAAGNVW